YDVATKSEKQRAALPADLGAAKSIRIVGDGDKARIFVVGKADDGKARAALFGLDGKVARRFGPADDIQLVSWQGQDRLPLHRAPVKTAGKGGVTHELELVDLDKGKRIGKLHTLELDGAGKSAKLDFRVDYFWNGYTHAAGVKGGHWDPKENQRTPDTAADYD